MPRQMIGCSSGSGGGGSGVVPIGRIREYVFGAGIPVPVAGTLYLDVVVPTSAAELRMSVDALLRRISVQVDVIDAARAFSVEILKGGAVIASLPLPVSTLGAHVATYSAAYLAGNLLSARIVRTSGAGKSTFRNVHVTVTLEE